MICKSLFCHPLKFFLSGWNQFQVLHYGGEFSVFADMRIALHHMREEMEEVMPLCRWNGMRFELLFERGIKLLQCDTTAHLTTDN